MDKVESQYNTRIEELRHSIDKLREELTGLEQLKSEETCRFRLGDRVVDLKGRKGEVISIRPGFDEGVAIVGLYKKDGTVGFREARAYRWYGWELDGMGRKGQL